MASYTNNLNLLKKDPITDGSDTFNIQAMMNDNWDKLDAQALKAQAAKAAPVDADKVPVVDSADAGKTKLVLWSAIKTALSSVFAAAAHSHAWSAITGKPSSFAPTAHKSTHATGGGDALTAGDISAATKPTTVTVTFTVAGWTLNSTTSCYEQTVAVTGMLAADGKNIRVESVGSTDAAAQALTDAAFALMDRVTCNTDGQLYARCPKSKPTVAFQAAVVISR